MFKTILVPLDGSAVGEAALPYAEALAARGGAGLTLVRSARIRAPLGEPGSDQQRVITEAESYLASVAQQLAAKGFRVETGVPYGESPAAWIVEEIGLRKAELVVMATHARTGPDRWLHGSVAEAVVSRATTPVLLVRAEGPHMAERFAQTQPTLLVALDGSELAEAALPIATDLATGLGGRVVLVGVVPRPGDLVAAQGGVVTYVGADHTRLQEEARSYLAQIAERLAAPELSVESALRPGAPATEIAAAAAEYSAAAIVMATHGRTGLARSILGSVAGQVLLHSPSPVLLTRPATLRGAEAPLPGPALTHAMLA